MLPPVHKYSARCEQIIGSLVFICLIIASQATAGNSSQQGWVLDQTTFHGGRFRLYVLPSAVKLVSVDSGFVLVSKAPTWKVDIYRPDSKILYELSLAEYYKPDSLFSGLFGTVSAEVTGLTMQSQEMTSGVKVIHYKSINGRDYSVADNLGASDVACSIVQRFYSVPRMKGIPLEWVVRGAPETASSGKSMFSEFADVHGTVKFLKTNSWKKQTLSISSFECPKGYTKVSHQREVFMGSSARKQLMDVIEDMGVGSKYGTK